MAAGAERILVRAPNWVGDQVLAFPFFHYLRKAYPRARIASVCVPWVADLQFSDLVDEVHVLHPPAKASLLARFAAVTRDGRALGGKGRWDLAISLPNSFSAAWLLYLSGATARRGYRAEGRSWLFTDAEPWNPDPGIHRSQAFVNLIPAPLRPSRPTREFWGIRPANGLDPDRPGELDRFEPARSWPGADPVEPPHGPYWVLAPGSKAESRRWPLENYARLARRVADSTGWKGVIVGSAAETGLAADLCEDRSLGLRDFTARGPVTALWRVFGGARFTVSNESGLAHVASLCGSPVHIVCGAADPMRTRPLGPGPVEVSVNAVECWPCERNTCYQPADKKIQCLRGITPEAVWDSVARSLRLLPEGKAQ